MSINKTTRYVYCLTIGIERLEILKKKKTTLKSDLRRFYSPSGFRYHINGRHCKKKKKKTVNHRDIRTITVSLNLNFISFVVTKREKLSWWRKKYSTRNTHN